MPQINELPQTYKILSLMYPSLSWERTQTNILKLNHVTQYASSAQLLSVALSIPQYCKYGIPEITERIFEDEFYTNPRFFRFLSIAQLGLRASGNAVRQYEVKQFQDENAPIDFNYDTLNAMALLNRMDPRSIQTNNLLSKPDCDDPFVNQIRDNTVSTRLLLLQSQFNGGLANPNNATQAMATQMLYLRAERILSTPDEKLTEVDDALNELALSQNPFQN